MSVIKLTGELTGKAVVFRNVIIKQIDIDKKFVGAIPHYESEKKWLMECSLNTGAQRCYWL